MFTDYWTTVLWLQNHFHITSHHLKRLMWVYKMSLLPTILYICTFSFTRDLFLQIPQYPRLNTKSLVIKCERVFLWSYSEIFLIKLKNDWCCKGHIFHLLFSNSAMSGNLFMIFKKMWGLFFFKFSRWWCNKISVHERNNN